MPEALVLSHKPNSAEARRLTADWKLSVLLGNPVNSRPTSAEGGVNTAVMHRAPHDAQGLNMPGSVSVHLLLSILSQF